MLPSKKDLQYIIMLAKGEKPEKRIKEYLIASFPDSDRLAKRIDVFNKSHEAIFRAYFKKFAKHLLKETILESYTAALESLHRGEDLEVAI